MTEPDLMQLWWVAGVFGVLALALWLDRRG